MGYAIEKQRAAQSRYRGTAKYATKQKRFWVVRYEFYRWLREAPCTDCGRTFPPECMDFDHVRGVKKINPSAMKGHSLERLQGELMKCDLVCACCHRIRTRARLAS